MEAKRAPTTLLVSMPWATSARPSLSLGVLSAIAEQNGFEVGCYEPNLEFAALVGVELFEFMSEKRDMFGIAEHLFSANLFSHEAVQSSKILGEFQSMLDESAGGSTTGQMVLERIRDEVIPGFLARTADRIVSQAPDIVGLSCTFNQVFPSLALAREIKQRSPDTVILLGGACVHGEMGEAYAEAFPQWVDHVFTGEADLSFIAFLNSFSRRNDVRIQGVTYAGKLHGIAEPLVDMTWMPPPNFDDHFAERLRLSEAGMALPGCGNLPFESSRGCWWGAKNHCTFCGLNNGGMKYRSKSAEQTVSEVLSLSQRYQMLDFIASDNILQRDGFRTVLPQLKEHGLDLSLFYEIKANVRRDEVAALAEAGVHGVQPGVESFSDNILRLMRKGVSALQNVQMIKWAQEWRVRPLYNILLGFEGESDDDYEEMYRLLNSIFHLIPPNITPSVAQVHRFSPFHEDPDRYQIKGITPCDYYEHLAPQTAIDPYRFAYFFERDIADDAVCIRHLPRIRELLKAWHDSSRRLTARLGPGFVTVVVEDKGRKESVRLSPLESLVLALTDAQTKVSALDRMLKERAPMGANEHTAAIKRLIELGFTVYQQGRLLSVVPYGKPRKEAELTSWINRHWPVVAQHESADPRRLPLV